MTTRRHAPFIALLSTFALFACTDDGDTMDTTVLDTGVDDSSTGDGDGDATTTAGDGDGDDPTTTGDGDGDDPTTTGDGDGDDPTTTGDGDGDDPTTTGGDSPCEAPDPGWGGSAQVGQPAPHFAGVNQFGDEMSICQYEGKPIVIDTSAVWCGPCQLLSLCLGGDDNSCLEVFGGNQQVIGALFNPLRSQLTADDFGWFTVLTENAEGGLPSAMDAQNWDQNFPAENVWVIPDVQQQYYGHLPIEAFPSVWLIDAQMNWQDLNQMTVWNTMIQSYL